MAPRNRMWLIYAILSVIASVVFPPNIANAALLPPGFLNCVVALGTEQQVSENGQSPHPQWQTEGTGFFYGYLVKNDPDPKKRQYEIYLVTAKHVVQGHSTQLGDLFVRVNPNASSSPGEQFLIQFQSLAGTDGWFFHPDQSIDLAAVRINAPMLRERGLLFDFFANDQHVANTEKLKSIQVVAGDGVFVLGFPMNLAGAQRNYVIVRQGIIARISEMLDHASQYFLIDSFVFPGNSGSPVVLKPELSFIEGTKGQPTAYLIGIVLSYIPYMDVAVSLQTQHPRVIFEENSGLAEVLPTNYIDEAIKAWRTQKGLEGSPIH